MKILSEGEHFPFVKSFSHQNVDTEQNLAIVKKVTITGIADLVVGFSSRLSPIRFEQEKRFASVSVDQTCIWDCVTIKTLIVLNTTATINVSIVLILNANSYLYVCI